MLATVTSVQLLISDIDISICHRCEKVIVLLHSHTNINKGMSQSTALWKILPSYSYTLLRLHRIIPRCTEYTVCICCLWPWDKTPKKGKIYPCGGWCQCVCVLSWEGCTRVCVLREEKLQSKRELKLGSALDIKIQPLHYFLALNEPLCILHFKALTLGCD